eukprot:TRINITY_DN2685_c0_g2_i4.p1 TRINITY_DN2685_c0_g2~~TRINITY_DN2685_c0_g2_i4.p1  ORF type:complete len:931 (+),score=213.14 TRINITY_DN2685_c0_g2_i4:1731-4523(+)
MMLSFLIQAEVSIERLETFFKGEELDPHGREEDLFMKDAISISGNFEWNFGEPVLQDIDISISKGELVAIVGEVGAGKSSLLSAILGEIPRTQGRTVVNGSLAYVPQNAWMKNATLRDNIFFGLEEDLHKYRKAIKSSQLTKDIQSLPGGDMTEIGEKGINLSGGQKQRVNLARAVYSDSDIYLLDDPLSAVDVHVGKAIFHNCICGALKEKTRVLVTHQLQFLHKCDKIILLENGRITNVGSYDELMSGSIQFNELISKHVFHDEEEENEEVGVTHHEPEVEHKEEEEGKLMVEEEKSAGGVVGTVYSKYFKSMGPGLVVTMFFFFITAQIAQMASDYWLSAWSSNATASAVNATMELNSTIGLNTTIVKRAVFSSPDFFMQTPVYSGSSMLTFGFASCCYPDWNLGVSMFFLVVYVIIGFISVALLLAASFSLAFAGVRASQVIHDDMLTRVMHVPTSYFDTVPLGRIINRFSSDQNAIDNRLPPTFEDSCGTLFTVLGIIFVIAAATPVFLIMLIPLSFLYRYAQSYYIRSSRELQRLRSVAQSPIFALFGETLVGLATIRAYNKQESLIAENIRRIDRFKQAEYAIMSVNRWLGVHLEFLGSCVVFSSAFFAVISRDSVSAAVAGLSISYSLRLTVNLDMLIRMSTEVETSLVSVERCMQYTELDQEAPYVNEYMCPPDWPSKGDISFKDLAIRYREGLPYVLNGLTVDIKAHEKVGVVGRTGAGKSSLVLALFRIMEASRGAIYIDGIDISKIGLKQLRSKLAIIPQEATLFSGTIRSNINPLGNQSDDQLWHVLEQVGMKDQIQQLPGQLDSPVSEGGDNISVGSRQLLCLARAILQKNKILVMDEATANVDYETDACIQKTIRKMFSDVTVITIAHRINTIMDYNRVMVLDKGKIAEYGNPQVLLQNPNSVFSGLVREGRALS